MQGKRSSLGIARRFAQKHDVHRSKGWAVKRMGLSLDQVTHAYVESQRLRLGSLTQSELVWDLLREHQRLTADCHHLREQLDVLAEQLKLLQQRMRHPAKRPRKS